MCWTNRTLNRKVAEHDITVYKSVVPDLVGCRSLVYNFKYNFNEIYTESFNIEHLNDIYYIFRGFHSYKTKLMALNRHPFYKDIVKCVIPKKAIYYENNNDEIVSNQIKIIDYEEI